MISTYNSDYVNLNKEVWTDLLFKKIFNFFKLYLWLDDHLDLGRFNFIKRWIQIAILIIHGTIRHECLLRATALTYISILSAVPMMAILIAIMAWYAVDKVDVLEKFILKKIITKWWCGRGGQPVI